MYVYILACFNTTLIWNTHHIQQKVHFYIYNETEAGTQTHDSSLDTIDWNLRQAFEMDSQEIDSYTSELTLRSVDERVKQATDPILSQVEELCALLANQTELESAGNNEAFGSRRDNMSASPSGNQHDSKVSQIIQTLEFFGEIEGLFP